MMSLSTSTGKSSSLSGPLAAFSLPLVTLSTASSAAAGAMAALPGTLVGGCASSTAWVAMLCALPSEGGNWRAGSSSEGKGDAVLGVPGAESGEDAMLDGGVAYPRHSPSPGWRAERRTTQQICQRAALVVGSRVDCQTGELGRMRCCSRTANGARAGPWTLALIRGC
jgi:hypothetical protein